MLKTVFPYNMQLFATVTNIVEHPWVFSPKNRQKIRQNPAKKTSMTFVLAIVKSILATQRNDFGFNHVVEFKRFFVATSSFKETRSVTDQLWRKEQSDKADFSPQVLAQEFFCKNL